MSTSTPSTDGQEQILRNDVTNWVNATAGIGRDYLRATALRVRDLFTEIDQLRPLRDSGTNDFPAGAIVTLQGAIYTTGRDIVRQNIQSLDVNRAQTHRRYGQAKGQFLNFVDRAYELLVQRNTARAELATEKQERAAEKQQLESERNQALDNVKTIETAFERAKQEKNQLQQQLQAEQNLRVITEENAAALKESHRELSQEHAACAPQLAIVQRSLDEAREEIRLNKQLAELQGTRDEEFSALKSKYQLLLGDFTIIRDNARDDAREIKQLKNQVKELRKTQCIDPSRHHETPA